MVRLQDQLAAEGFCSLIYDGRGSGFSDRNRLDFSLDARLRDLEAVVSAAAFDRLVIVVPGTGASAALLFAHRKAEKVSHFVMVNPLTRSSALEPLSSEWRLSRGLQSAAQDDWEFVSMTVANAIFEYADRDLTRDIAKTMRDGLTGEAWAAYLEQTARIDVDDLMRSLRIPTLIVYDSSAGGVRAREVAQQLAPQFQAAQLVETQDAARAIRDFVGGRSPDRITRTSPSSMTAILFADIADSTALTERLGDAAFREKARELEEALRRAIGSNGGTAIEGKLLGDGVLATFGAAREAIACAQALHEAGRHAGLPLHVGIHAGDVIRERAPDGRDNVYGGAVNIASRIADESAAGETLVSATVRDLARTSAGVSFEDRGERELKGVSEPVRVWAVGVIVSPEEEDVHG
jgi:class 3 adenylate cyclase